MKMRQFAAIPGRHKRLSLRAKSESVSCGTAILDRLFFSRKSLPHGISMPDINSVFALVCVIANLIGIATGQEASSMNAL
jgi:hypothetical protein